MPSLDRLQMDIELELQKESIETLLDRLIAACCRSQDSPKELSKHQYWTRVIGAIMTCRENVVAIRLNELNEAPK